MLPPNMTSRVQMLDVGLNRPFKVRVQAAQRQFMLDQIEADIQKPKITRELMTKWIADAWEAIDVSVIRNTAHKIGFINEI